jgi:hypothetical protein
MINFRKLEDDSVVALQDQHDGSTRVIAEARKSHTSQKPDPVLFTAWEVIDDKMNSVRKIAVAQALAMAYAAQNHAAVLRDLMRKDDGKPD